MAVPRTTITKRLSVGRGLTLALLLGFSAHAAETRPPVGKSGAPCAVIEHFEGDVQILDSSRNDLIFTSLGAAVPCGGWVTVRQGWAQLRHKDGHTYKVAPETFLEVFDPTGNPAGKSPTQLVLYRGRVWVDVPGGTPTFRIASANGLAELSNGVALIAYSQADEETQLLSLRGKSTLTNRFQANRVMMVQAGELTTLNLKLMRVIPTSPAPASIASVKQLLVGLPITANEREHSLAAVQRRLDRKFAHEPKGDRKVASESEEKDPAKEADRYRRYPAASESGASGAQAHLVSHLTGGEPGAEKSLHPKGSFRKSKRGMVAIEDPALEADRKHFREEEAEKKQLIDELSKIRSE